MALGEHDLALEALKGSAADRRAWWPFMRIDPTFDALRGRPIFQELLDAAGVPPLRDKQS
jgi:hypothetical protein